MVPPGVPAEVVRLDDDAEEVRRPTFDTPPEQARVVEAVPQTEDELERVEAPDPAIGTAVPRTPSASIRDKCRRQQTRPRFLCIIPLVSQKPRLENAPRK